MQRLILAFSFMVVGAMGCSDDAAGALGDSCVASSECGEGLTCDFGRQPPSCQASQTPVSDASIIDASVTDGSVIDAPTEIDGAVPDLDAS